MITPIELELHHFCQYKKMVMPFHTGITGYIGPNGTGKTNLIDTGLFFAITGDTGPFQKEELIRHGAASGHTRFTFDHNGLRYNLTRNLHNSSVKLEWQSSAEEKPQEEKGKDNVGRLMEEMIGIPFDVFREVCWGAQEGLTAVLKMTHTNRMLYFQRLANVIRTEGWRSTIQEKISKLPVIADRSMELQTLLNQLKEADAQSEICLNRMNELAASGKSPEEYAARLEETARRLGMQDQIMHDQIILNFRKMLEDVKQKLIEARRKQTEARTHLDIPMLHPNAEEWNRRFLRCTELTKELDQLQGCTVTVPEPLPKPETAQLGTLQTQLTQMQPSYQMAVSKVCPTCKRPFDVTDADRIISTYEGLSREYQELSRKVTQQSDSWAARDREIVTAQARKKAHEQRLETVSQEIQKQLMVEPAIPLDFNPVQYAQQKAELQKYQAQESVRAQCLAEVTRLESSVRNTEEQLKTAEAAPYLSAAEKAALEEERRQIQFRTSDFRTLELNLATHQSTRKILLEQKQKLEVSEEKRRTVEGVVQALTKVRDRLHKDCLPKIVMSKMLNGMNAYLAYYLSRFNAPFTARITDDFDFEAVFPNGTVMPGRSLSGGQKVALIFSFKFAQSEMFGRNIPLMVLDEPTTWLDAENIGKMGELFKLARGFTERGVFLVVATHEPQILSTMSRVIELCKEKE